MIDIDKDYLITVDLKKSSVKSDRTIFFYNTDLNICNIFIKLICTDEDKSIPNDLVVELGVLKPESNEFKTLNATLISEEDLLYEVDLTTDYFDIVGKYECEIRISGTVDGEMKCLTSESFNYIVKPNITTKLDNEIKNDKNLPVLEKLIKDVKELSLGIETNQVQMKTDENLVGDNKTIVGAINQLREDVNSGIGGGTVDLTNYQKKNDETLNTTSKEIVGAINEVNTQCKDIANELGRNEGNPIDMGTTSTTIRGAIKELKDNQNSGGVTDEQVQNAVTNYLTENPIKVGNTVVKLSDTKVIGEIWNNPTDITYMAWSLGLIQYDKDLDMIVQMCACNSTHTEGNEASGCYVAYINPNTYEVIDPVIVNDSGGNHIGNPSGFCITKDGEWLLSVEYKLYRSSDKGITWTLQGEFVDSEGTALNTTYSIISAYRNFYQFKSGRLAVGAWSSNKVYMFYSDDNGLTWSASLVGQIAKGNQEPCFIEMEEGKILSVIRKTMYGTGITDWSLTAKRIIEPAYISHSEDNGNSWSTPVASTKLTEMTACPCFGFNHEDEGIVELFYCSRYEHGNSEGVMYQTKATYEDARNDNFDEPVVVLYPITPIKTNGTGSDFGYVTGCKDGKGKLHLVYYDVSDKNENIITYKYILADREKVVFPRNNNIINPIVGWSSKKIDNEIKKIYSSLNSKISEIIIQNGGSVEDTGDGTLYTTDGLYEMFDFIDESLYDVETASYKGKIKSLILKKSSSRWSVTTPEDTSFDTNGLSIGIMETDISNDITDDNFTIEVLVKVNTVVTSNNNFLVIGSTKYNAFNLETSLNSRFLYKYINTEGTTNKTDSYYVKTGMCSTTGYHLITISKDNIGFHYYYDGKLDKSFLFSDITDFKSIQTNFFNNGYFLVNGERVSSDISIITNRVYSKALTEKQISNNYLYEKNKFGF